jgi:nucleoside-diphosphate-sugar epimerase
MLTVLIAGANGFLGRNLYSKLSDSGFRVIGLTRQTPNLENSPASDSSIKVSGGGGDYLKFPIMAWSQCKRLLAALTSLSIA